VKRKKDLDVATAFALGLSPSQVSTVTREFASQLIEALSEDGEVMYDGFGQFRVKEQRGTMPASFGEKTDRVAGVPMLRVTFKKSVPLRKELAMSTDLKDGMDKYAVDETSGVDQEKLEKLANEGCPECGSELSRHGNVILCAKCGSKPFEGLMNQDGSQEKDDNPY